jgi:hypothetical protein
VRRFLAVVGISFAMVPAARAASIAVVPKNFSPAVGSLSISGSAPDARSFGFQLANAKGVVLGWLSPPARGPLASLFWDGTLNGELVPDGYYSVWLVADGQVLAQKPIRIDTTAPELGAVAADDGSTPFAGDGPLLTTISPNGDGLRDAASFHFTLSEPAWVTLSVSRTQNSVGAPLYTRALWFHSGPQTAQWAPAAGLGPRTYLVRLTTADAAGNSKSYGADSPWVGRSPRAPVVRLMGIDAAFEQASYAPDELATLRISTDETALKVQFFQAGPEHIFTGSDSVMNGVPVGAEASLDWTKRRNATAVARLGLGPWPSGLYFAQLTAQDGTVGYAPFVLRPPALGAHRVLIVLPATTWQAYNFWDTTGDGWGDTWYTGAPHRTVRLGRPFLRRGVIPFFRRYDLGFLHWMAWTGKEADYVADSDLATRTGEELAHDYDLIVFPGHSEYVGDQVFNAVEQYRNLGGNLAFLSANNFYWRIEQNGDVLRRTRPWRTLGRPEGAVIGAQYLANDEGHRQSVYVVSDPGAAPWLWDKTGLEAGGTFGEFVGGYGIEVDAVGTFSPPGTQVLAQIPDLLGPGLGAQMSYYETAEGAKVFAAGTLDFGGSATFWPVSRILENLWARLAAP